MCQLCSFWCPSDCIFIGNTNYHRVLVNIWTIDRKRCIFCGNCTIVCPVNAISQNGTSPNITRVLTEVLV